MRDQLAHIVNEAFEEYGEHHVHKTFFRRYEAIDERFDSDEGAIAKAVIKSFWTRYECGLQDANAEFIRDLLERVKNPAKKFPWKTINAMSDAHDINHQTLRTSTEPLYRQKEAFDAAGHRGTSPQFLKLTDFQKLSDRFSELAVVCSQPVERSYASLIEAMSTARAMVEGSSSVLNETTFDLVRLALTAPYPVWWDAILDERATTMQAFYLSVGYQHITGLPSNETIRKAVHQWGPYLTKMCEDGYCDWYSLRELR